MKTKSLLIFLSIFLLISLVSANGLTISPYNINLNKTYGQNKIVNITISNTESFNFSNITIVNPEVSIPKINVLLPGQNVTVPLTIKTNQDINKDIIVKGFYETKIGTSHNVYDSNILWPNSPTTCSLNAYKGDKIVFHNQNDFDVTIKNANTLSDIKVLNANETYTWLLSKATTIVYNAVRGGFPFGNSCTVNIMNTTGIINNPTYDGILKLKVTNLFKTTKLTTTFPQIKYNVSIFNNQQGFIKIINNGVEIAKGVNLKGDWFSFSDNNFDIQPGVSRVISYTIKLGNNIHSTNSTNKTYYKNVSITGNFPTVTQKFTLFLPYQQILNATTNSTSDFLQWIKENYPELLKPKVVIRYVDNNSRDINITTSQEKLNGLATAIFATQDYSENTFKRITEELNALNSTINGYTISNTKNSDAIIKLQSNFSKNNNTSLGFILVLVFLAVAVMGGFILKFAYQKNKVKDLERWDLNARQ